MKKVKRLERELLKVLTEKYCQYEIDGEKFSLGEIFTEVENDKLYVFFEECDALYEIINFYDNIEPSQYEKLDSILMNVCNKYNYDYECENHYSISFYKC